MVRPTRFKPTRQLTLFSRDDYNNKNNGIIEEKKLKRIPLFSIVIFLFFQSAAASSQEGYSKDYRIGPKDLLEINVFGVDQLNRKVRVSEDGKITLPLLGEISVEGLTKSDLEKNLAKLLQEKYIQNPQVTVFILEYQSKKVSVIGAVKNTGNYELLGRQTLLQIISQAGGFTTEAGNEIIVIRQLPDGSSTSLNISLENLMVKGDAKLNIPLEPNDIINVLIDKIVYVYVTGEVKQPGALAVRKSNIPTLLRAIAQAGGFTDRASKGSVVLKRRDENGKETKEEVNVKNIIKGKKPDIQLKENDVVIVSETIF